VPNSASAARCFSCVDGLTAYQSIEASLGVGSIESPDYSNGHMCPHDSIVHITCAAASDYSLGRALHFLLHIAQDCETVENRAGRQRNEIKVYSQSDDSLKGFYGTTMIYSWHFRVGATMQVSRKFTHIFQAKFVGGDDSHPAATFTGAKKSGVDVFEVRYAATSEDVILASVPWTDVAGQWMNATVEMRMLPIGSGGRLKVHVSRLHTAQSVVSVDQSANLWRADNEFMRPKWGLYRQSEHANIAAGDLNDADQQIGNICIERIGSS